MERWARPAARRWCRAAPSFPAGGRRAAPLATAAAAGQPGDQVTSRVLFEELKQKFGYMGAVNHKRVGVPDLYEILRLARSPDDYRVGLEAMNLFYNFGVKLRHRELASRLLAAAMACRVEEEAVEIIKLYGTWLQHPPDTALVYAVMSHFLDSGQPLVVREIAKAVREDWRMRVEPPLYALAVEAMLRLPEAALEEALALQEDAARVGVPLPAPVHARLLEEALGAFEAASGSAPEAASGAAEAEATEEPPEEDGAAAAGAAAAEAAPSEEALGRLRQAVLVADRLAADGHLHGGGGAGVLCSVSWLLWRLAALPAPQRDHLLADRASGGDALALFGGDWRRTLGAAAENFGCHWGFSRRLPSGFFRALEACSDPTAAEMVAMCRVRFGRFYPTEGAVSS